MIKILANDGIDPQGKKIFEDAGFSVSTDKVKQDDLGEALKNFDAILVRSATQVRKEHIDACPNLKLIGRAGVGMDNIDVAYAREKGLHVVNTPDASSQSVAELVFANMFSIARQLYDANRKMPFCDSKEQFESLKKKYSTGIELKGKTLGIIGFGKIGQAVARMALGVGMKVMPFKLHATDVKIEIDFFQAHSNSSLMVTMKCVPFEELLSHSDFITLHVPFPKGAPPVLAAKEFNMMKNGVAIVNTARGGAVSEADLLQALNSGKVSAAALDVFEGEPLIRQELRDHSQVILTPHIGGSTKEAQERIGVELATKVVQLFNHS
jgi:D-3-phosphoglycerate dehydrogenase / 2-oxoglutarate reductase